jgi:hypothetical protein
VVLAGVAAGVWLLVSSWDPDSEGDSKPGTNTGKNTAKNGRPSRPGSRQTAAPLKPPKKLRTDFDLKVVLLGKGPDDDDLRPLRPGTDGLLHLREGGEVKYRVKVAKAAYVGIWSVNADGTVCQLFPNDDERDHHFAAGEERLIPRTRVGLSESSGSEWVWVQASAIPWDPDKGERMGPFRLFKKERDREEWAKKKRDMYLQPEGTLTEAVLKYRVGPR